MFIIIIRGMNERYVVKSGNHDIMAVQSYVTVSFYDSNSQMCVSSLHIELISSLYPTHSKPHLSYKKERLVHFINDSIHTNPMIEPIIYHMHMVRVRMSVQL